MRKRWEKRKKEWESEREVAVKRFRKVKSKEEAR